MLNSRTIITNGQYRGLQIEEPHKLLKGRLTIYNNGQELECYISKHGNDYNHMCLIDKKTLEQVIK